jgi:hypothetical protein
MSNILYVSCHSVLEWDELKIFRELGHKVFSCGSYINPILPAESIRDPLNLVQNKDWLELFHKTKCKLLPNGLWVFSKEFLKEFDIVIFMHSYQSLINSIKMLGGKKVYWRSIGQSTQIIEKSISRIKNEIQIIRYSPMEKLINGYAGENHIIRFYKSKSDYLKRNQEIDKIIIFYNAFLNRSNHFNIHFYNWHIKNLPHDIFGANEVSDIFKGSTSFEKQVELLSKYKSAYIVNTYPAQYTLSFIESLAAEIPIIIDKDQAHMDERISLLENNDIFYNFDFMNESILEEKIKIQNRVFEKNFDKLKIKKEWNKLL